MRRLQLVALLAVLVTGGIAAVYRGPSHPAGEDANAAGKAARAKSHVLFDPSEYADDGEPAPESFLQAFRLNFAYWRGAILPGGTSEPIPQPPVSQDAAPTSSAPTPPVDLPKAPPVAMPGALPIADGASVVEPVDPEPSLAQMFVMAGISQALNTQTGISSASFAPGGTLGTSSPRSAEAASEEVSSGRANSQFDALALTWTTPRSDRRSVFLWVEGIPTSDRPASWSQYFILAPVDASSSPPSDDASAPISPPDPLQVYAVPIDANLSPQLAVSGDDPSVTPEAVPEPGTWLLVSLALTLLWRWRSNAVSAVLTDGR